MHLASNLVGCASITRLSVNSIPSPFVIHLASILKVALDLFHLFVIISNEAGATMLLRLARGLLRLLVFAIAISNLPDFLSTS